MCCAILVAAARQPCDRGSSSGKDDDQEWAAIASRIIQSAICLCAALPGYSSSQESALGLVNWPSKLHMLLGHNPDISPMDLVHSRTWLCEFTFQACHKLQCDLSAGEAVMVRNHVRDM